MLSRTSRLFFSELTINKASISLSRNAADQKEIISNIGKLERFCKGIKDPTIKAEWIQLALSEANNSATFTEILYHPDFQSYHSIETVKTCTMKINQLHLDHTSLSFVESRFRRMLCGKIDVLFMNEVLKWHNSWQKIQSVLLFYHRKYFIVPNDDTFDAIIRDRCFTNSEQVINACDWMVKNLKFVITNRTFESAVELDFDCRELSLHFMNHGLQVPMRALKSFVYYADDKFDCIKDFTKEFGYKVDTRIMNWYVQSSVNQATSALDLINKFKNEFGVSINVTFVISVVNILVANENIPDLCKLVLMLNPNTEDKLSISDRLFKSLFLNLKGKRIDKFREYLPRIENLFISEALECLEDKFSNDFLLLYKNERINAINIVHLCISFFKDLNENDVSQLSLVLSKLPKNILVTHLITKRLSYDYISYWKVLQSLQIDDSEALIFLERLRKSAFWHWIVTNTSLNYLHCIEKLDQTCVH